MKITKEFLEEYAQKMSAAGIARRFGLSEHTIRRKEREFNINRSQYKDVQAAIRHNAHKSHTANWLHLRNCDEIGSYFIGLFIASASLFIAKRSQIPCFGIGLQIKDRSILEQFIEDHKITNKLIERKSNGKSNGSVHLHINDIELVTILCSYGMEPGPNYKCDPPSVYFIFDLIRGYFDGNGLISMTPNKPGKLRRLNLRLRCINEKMGMKLQSILKTIGYNAKLWLTRKVWTLAINGTEAERLAAEMWNNPQRFLKRKHDTYIKWLEYRKTNLPHCDAIKERNTKIAARIAEGASTKQIMDEFGLKKTQMYEILRLLNIPLK